MQAPSPLARPWRDTPAARPAFSSLAVSYGPASLSIVSTHLVSHSANAAACCTFITVFIWVLYIQAAGPNLSWSAMKTISLYFCLVMVIMVTYVIYENMRVWQQTFTFSKDKWEVACRHAHGLQSTRQCASGHTTHLVAARVVATGTTAFQLTTAIQILEASRVTSTAQPTVSTVYTTGANSVPLSLTEQEFIVAEVNRYIERTRGTPIPDLIENTLFVDAGGTAVLASPPHAHRCPVPPLVMPVFAGGAPFARPMALVPRAPLTGCRMSASLTEGGLGREGCTIVLQRNLLMRNLLTRSSAPLVTCSWWMLYVALYTCSVMHLLSAFWVVVAVGVLAGSVQLLVSLSTVDQLLLNEHDWVLKQHTHFRVWRGGQWKRGTVVDSGPLSDLLGAQVLPSTCFKPVLGLHHTFCVRFCISLDPLATDMLSPPC
jgi:hypothetical protein